MWNLRDTITQVKNAFSQALQSIPEFVKLDAKEKGKVIDANFKSLVKDLMKEFGMIPGEDYEDDTRNNEPGADFVILSERANNLMKDLLDGKITVVKEHTRVSKAGNTYTVIAHYRKIA
ncbi:MAG: hypothetical protein AN483_11565 [Aphanizomenon flos-aquae MDT14a]|jgi:hypothetical protein|uniref:Uncharacterized protein n=1 Tax=Aphanizomenon flos-aquae LD13 TaxID=1710894 RepID=A0A1B7VXH0_APHFL|nr:hypothetical protein [Aphanizomenon flos-aquae UKL13-PB]MBO1060603.1 hypothetical protein [Aphanizomenon flos-aquae CP01]OBQ25658.1 MAG: hypothetical protein AN481_08930 [Aphanizomenon flos-aquae LD13]OBQ29204.1 MAG: hypothetical protein AN483_11565 [Aphanizomenon flos-aquae MDT14a]HCQ21114.1 hypothetical protein [Anabaena sp. UBA12330]